MGLTFRTLFPVFCILASLPFGYFAIISQPFCLQHVFLADFPDQLIYVLVCRASFSAVCRARKQRWSRGSPFGEFPRQLINVLVCRASFSALFRARTRRCPWGSPFGGFSQSADLCAKFAAHHSLLSSGHFPFSVLSHNKSAILFSTHGFWWIFPH